MKVKVKKLNVLAQVPVYAKDSDAGLDLTAISREETDLYVEYGTGLAFEIPEGYVGLIFPRSSISTKNMVLANSVGVIDSGYRGEVKFRFKKVKNQAKHTSDWYPSDHGPSVIYNISEKVGQMIILPYPKVELEETDELGSSERGEGGFGSTGK